MRASLLAFLCHIVGGVALRRMLNRLVKDVHCFGFLGFKTRQAVSSHFGGSPAFQLPVHPYPLEEAWHLIWMRYLSTTHAKLQSQGFLVACCWYVT